MIIVDAMQFAFTHPGGASLCFVTGDVDYAYLLAVLKRPQWRSIVISKGTMQSMLHVNCDIKMCWESDVLQLKSSLPSAPPGFHGAAKVSGESNMLSLLVTSSESLDELQASTSHDLTRRIIQNDDTSETLSVVALTIVEEWTSDAELLRTIVREAPKARTYAASLTEGHHVARKSHVGSTLRRMHADRFPDRRAMRDFLARAVETGIVIESGEGAFKTFRLPSDEPAGAFRPVICLSGPAPVATQDMRGPCWSLVEARSDSDKIDATECIKVMLGVMAENDDIYCAENMLRKQLVLRWPSACASREHSALWIQDAVDAGEVIRFKRPNIKTKFICCPRHYQLAMAPFPPADIDTSAEEMDILDMLWEDKNGWVKRTEAIARLKENFEKMQSPFLRNKCSLNAASKKKSFLARGPWGQTLGLTIEDAQAALDIAYPPNEAEEPTTCDSRDHSLVEDKKDTAKAAEAMANHADVGRFVGVEEHDSRGSPISVESFWTSCLNTILRPPGPVV
jgi:hypothetical protein